MNSILNVKISNSKQDFNVIHTDFYNIDRKVTTYRDMLHREA